MKKRRIAFGQMLMRVTGCRVGRSLGCGPLLSLAPPQIFGFFVSHRKPSAGTDSRPRLHANGSAMSGG